MIMGNNVILLNTAQFKKDYKIGLDNSYLTCTDNIQDIIKFKKSKNINVCDNILIRKSSLQLHMDLVARLKVLNTRRY